MLCLSRHADVHDLDLGKKMHEDISISRSFFYLVQFHIQELYFCAEIAVVTLSNCPFPAQA